MVFDRVFNNDSLHIWYEGKSKHENFDSVKIFEKLEIFFNNKSFNNDLLKIILYVRTVLKDVEEFLLMIKTSKDDVVVNVRYINGSFTEYSRTELLDESSKEDKITFNYTCDRTSKISFSNNSNIEKYKIAKKIQEVVSNGLDFVSKLEEQIKPRVINSNDKLLIYMYETFFGKKLSSIDENIEKNMQSMLYILNHFDIPFEINGRSVNFYIYDEYPESFLVSNWVEDLIMIEEQKDNERPEISFIEEIVISEFGNIFLSNLPKENFDESLSRFCTAVFFKTFLCNFDANEEEVSQRICSEQIGNYSEQELKMYFDIQKKLEEKYKEIQNN